MLHHKKFRMQKTYDIIELEGNSAYVIALVAKEIILEVLCILMRNSEAVF